MLARARHVPLRSGLTASTRLTPLMTIPLHSSRRGLASSSSRKQTSQPQSSSRPLYASQAGLPHLPVPTLSSTFHKYLETVLPLLSPTQHAHTTSLVKTFLASEQAQTLQKRLEQRAKDKDSWLSEWWNEVAYMGYRGRIVPNVSYWYTHKRGLGKGKNQEDRAAELVRATVEFQKLVDSEMLEPERAKGQPMCMASYKYFFNASRIPTSPSDTPLAHPTAHHIVVVRNNRFFKVDTEGRSASELVEAFRKIKKTAASHKGSGIGVLTVDDRDVWTEFRQHLQDLSPKNAATLKTIESAILLICLDDDPSPRTEEERAWRYWAGGLDRTPSGKAWNRWFDKHEIIIDSNGESGFNGEHSMLDGTPTLRMNEFILAALDKGKIPLELPEAERNRSPMPNSEELEFVLDKELQLAIAKSQKGFEKEMELQDLKIVHFTAYGKNTMKAYKTSPDAWAQLIKQLAFFRMFNRPGVTYESAQTRKFLLGRTEVIRSTSAEAKAFCEAMLNPKVSDIEREKLFKAAVGRHIQYAAWAVEGQGVDRHMFGLRMLVKEGEEMPEVFKDEAFGKSSHWEMSTSQLSTPYLEGWGYGEVVEDGYGLSYEINDDSIRWGVTTKNNNATEFGKALVKSAEDIEQMMAHSKKESKEMAKL